MLTTIHLCYSAYGLVLYPWTTVGSCVPCRDDGGIAATTTYDGVCRSLQMLWPTSNCTACQPCRRQSFCALRHVDWFYTHGVLLVLGFRIVTTAVLQLLPPTTACNMFCTCFGQHLTAQSYNYVDDNPFALFGTWIGSIPMEYCWFLGSAS